MILLHLFYLCKEIIAMLQVLVRMLKYQYTRSSLIHLLVSELLHLDLSIHKQEGSNSKNNTFTWWDTLYNMNEWDWIIPGMITSHQTLYGTGEKWINLINPIVKPTFTLYSLWHHCSLVYILSNQYFFALSLLMRVIAGVGSSMLTVAVTSTLMKATSFKSTTVIVSQGQITVKVKSVCWYQQISCSGPKIGGVSWGTRPIRKEAIMALLLNSCLLLLPQSSFSGLSTACLYTMLEI